MSQLKESLMSDSDNDDDISLENSDDENTPFINMYETGKTDNQSDSDFDEFKSDSEEADDADDNELEDDSEPELTTERDEECFYQYEIEEEETLQEGDNKLVPDEERITPPVLTIYEKVRILGVRAKQLAMGAKVMLKNPGNKSALELAELELKHNMIPFIIHRPLPNGKYERWKLSELEKLD